MNREAPEWLAFLAVWISMVGIILWGCVFYTFDRQATAERDAVSATARYWQVKYEQTPRTYVVDKDCLLKLEETEVGR